MLTASRLLRRGLCSPGRSLNYSSTSSGSTTSNNVEENIQRSLYPAPTLPTVGVSQYIMDYCTRLTNRTAMIDGVTRQSLTYGGLVDGMQRWGAVVQKRGQPGSQPPTVALFMLNCPDYPVIFFGSTLVGAYLNLLNPTYTAEEVAYQLQDGGANLLVVDSNTEETALKARRLLQERGHEPPELFVVGPSSHGHSDLRTLLSDRTAPFAEPVDVDPSSMAMLPYSSGTTGRPKGVCVSHGALTANLEMLNSAAFHRAPDLETPDIYLGLLPFFHIYGIVMIMLHAFRNSSTVVTLPNFQQNTFVQAFKDHKFTILSLVPPLIKFINENDDVNSEDMQSCKTVVCGAAPLSKSSAEQFAAKCGGNVSFREGYGMTEILVTHLTPVTGTKLGYCGKLLPYAEAKIIDVETRASLPSGESGELLIKTPSMMAGYHQRADATKETIDEDGWLHTGDIAVYDADGYFSIVDRMKELIKVKAFQVSPSELEDVLLKHPAIADVGVIGIPHDSHGEVPRAYIVKSKKASITEAEVNAYMKEHLARHKQLAGGIKFVDDLPKNSTGKLLRKKLAEMAASE